MTKDEEIAKLKKQLKNSRARARKYYSLHHGAINAANFFSRYK